MDLKPTQAKLNIWLILKWIIIRLQKNSENESYREKMNKELWIINLFCCEQIGDFMDNA